jgi:acetyl-CoA decarbonylase/synthase complex subunit epsilon
MEAQGNPGTGIDDRGTSVAKEGVAQVTATIPWQTGNVVGPKNALLVDPENSARLLRAAKRPLIVVGAYATKPSVGLLDLPAYVLRLATALKAQIAASPTIQSQFNNSDNTQVFSLGLEDLTNRLKDSQWKGFDGKGAYDSVLFIGGVYYFASQMLATLKHFAPHVRTVSLDRFYHPNASFSFPNMAVERWRKGLDVMIQELVNSD